MERWQKCGCTSRSRSIGASLRISTSGWPTTDTLWCASRVPPPVVFPLLRPIALLGASAKMWPRLMFGRFQPLEENGDPGAMVLEKAYTVLGLVLDFRFSEITLEWGGYSWAAQPDFVAASGSVEHSWLLKAMIRRGVPRAEALWYIWDTQKSTLNPTHGPWSAGEICPERGLKQLFMFPYVIQAVCAGRVAAINSVLMIARYGHPGRRWTVDYPLHLGG